MIRSCSLRDVLTLSKLESQGVTFDLRRSLFQPAKPILLALSDCLSRHHLGAMTYVHEGEGNGNRPPAFAQVRPRAHQAAWDLIFLAPALDVHESVPEAWAQLLSYLIINGAAQGVLRIYARLPEDAGAESIFRQAGFTVVAREEVFARHEPPAPVPLPKGLRPMTLDDRGELERLCCQTVPKLVQQAEGPLPWWCSACRHSLIYPATVHEYVWMDKGQMVAYLGLCSNAKGAWLEVLVRPERRAEVLPHLKYMIHLAECSRQQPMYCAVADYDVGLGWLLRTLGFASYTRQVLLVAHTFARVPAQKTVVVRGLERGVDIGASIGHVCQAALSTPLEPEAVRRLWEEEGGDAERTVERGAAPQPGDGALGDCGVVEGVRMAFCGAKR